ncbi:hypothetical protein MBRA1_002083 [Malassezia brasiliensis]|uniref:Aromatic-L-amino-acid decarboxylase n=1 Tax=Malassezia brasiliensis TaxID=1821822 RepID=A0AAF0DSL5_9BASI|nr:hypothetical protein MBRA1_002083 [Malassezia brasiliensis]
MDLSTFRRAAHAAVDRICDYYATIEQLPVAAQVERGYLARALPDAAPTNGEAWEQIERDFEQHILPGMTHWQHPMFFGFFPSNATYEGIIADMYTSALTNPGFNWNASPAVTELEFIVLDWLAKMMGLSSAFYSNDLSHSGGGVILGGASEATLTIAISARERALRALAEQHSESSADPIAWRAAMVPKLVMYGTTQTHSVGAKAAMMLGIRFRALDVARKDQYGLRGETLRAAIEEDTARGRIPFMLVATYGTTNSCAIDHLDEIAEVAKSSPLLWLHVDAAYGGVTWCLPENRPERIIAAFNARFDSLSTNLHKWGLVQMECSPTFVRDRHDLAKALSMTPDILKSKGMDPAALNDLRNLQIVLGRRFRALKVWFMLRSYGTTGFQEHLRRSIALARSFADQLRDMPAFEIVNPPRWGLVMFRLRAPDESVDVDALNHALNDALLERSDQLFLSPTVLPEVGYCERLVVGAPATTEEHIQKTLRILQECADSVLSK